jgi:hypothetical protein
MTNGSTGAVTPADDDESVLFVPRAVRSGFTEHSGLKDKVIERVSDLRDNYNAVLRQIAAMVKDSDNSQPSSGLRLKEISVALGFDASGKLGFITSGVEAGVSATVTVTLARSESK